MTALMTAYKHIYGTDPKACMSLLKTGRQWEHLGNLLKRTKGETQERQTIEGIVASLRL